MKKSIKRTAATLLVVATTAGVAGTTALSLNNTIGATNKTKVVHADTATAGDNTLNISEYSKTVRLNSEFVMPTTAEFVVNGSSKVALTEYTVKTPSGKTFTQAAVTGGKFKVEEIGTYTITYKKDNYIGEISFKSEVSDYSMSIVSNTSNILPSKVGTTFTGTLNLPTVKVVDEDGETVDVILEVSYTDPNFASHTVTDSKIVFDADNAMTEGNYIITYRAYENKGTAEAPVKGDFLCDTKTQFTAVKNYENEYDLTLVYGSEKPTSVNIGKTITLPSITAKNGTEAVPVFYEVKVLENGTTDVSNQKVGNTDTTILSKNDNNEWEFTAGKMGVYYKVEYTVKDALGNTKTTGFNIDKVEDTLNPTPIVVDAYKLGEDEEANQATLKALENKDYALKSIFGLADDGVRINAIYAEDFGTFNYSDFKFERRIENKSRELVYKSTDIADAGKILMFNYKGTEEEQQALEETGLYKFVPTTDADLKDGEYYVYYTVTDANNNKASISYKFTVDKNFEWTDTKPTVKFNDTFYSRVDLGEKITFGEVTAKDDKDDRCEVKVSYKYVVGGVEQDEHVLELNDDNQYVIDTSKDVPENAQSVVIYATATNDGGKTNEVKLCENKIVITLTDNTASASKPSVYDVVEELGYSYSYVQGSTIQIPQLVFHGENGVDNLNATISVKYINSEEVEDVNVSNIIAFKVGEEYIFSGAKFAGDKVGSYQVAVRVTDAAGNVVIKFLDYTVTSAAYTGKLRFENLGFKDVNTLELGETFKLPNATLVGDGAEDWAWYAKCVESEGDYEISNTEFKPLAVGEYKIKYVMYEKENRLATEKEDEQTLFITVSDTKGPQINVLWETEVLNDQDGKQTIAPAYDKGTKILIPKFSASDMSGIDEEKSTVVISSSKTTRTIKYSEMNAEYSKDGNMYYTFNNDAEYTITYTAYDKKGNVSTVTKTIVIGDLVAPVLTVSDKIVDSTYKSGQVLTIDLANDSLNYIQVSDNKDSELTKEDVKVSLYLNGTVIEKDSSLSTDTKYVFNLKDAGEYELRFEVKDEAGNTTLVTKTFKIQDKESSNMTSTEIIGTVLIVVSVVVLAGVVVYFVVSKKKMDKIYKG